MPEPVQPHIAGHSKTAQVIFRASSRHDASCPNVVHDFCMGDRSLRPTTLNAKGGRVHQKHRHAQQAKPMSHRQSVVPVKDQMIDGVNHKPRSHRSPADVHMRTLPNTAGSRGLMRVHITEVHEGGTKLHLCRSLPCDKDMSSRRRT